MNIIGVELHTPKRSELEGLAVLTAVYVVAAIAVVSSGLIEWPMVVAALIGMVSGTIASACGCSIIQHGVRGAILSAGLCLVLMGSFAAIVYAVSLI